MRSRSLIVCVLVVASALFACKQLGGGGEAEGDSPATAEAPLTPATVLQTSGELDLELTPSGDTATLRVGDAHFELAVKGTNLDLSQGGALLYKLTRESDRIKIRLPNGTVTHKLKFKKDGLELEEEGGQRLNRSKSKDYGYKVYDGQEKVLVAVKLKGNRVEAKRESGEEVWRMDGVTPITASVLGFEALKPELRAALMYMLHRRPA